MGIGYKKLKRNVASFYSQPEEQDEMDKYSQKSIGGSSLFDETEGSEQINQGGMRNFQRTAIGEKKLKRLEIVKSTSLYTKNSITSTGQATSDQDIKPIGNRTPMIINKDKLNESMDRRI
jgi:hypothetical protein